MRMTEEAKLDKHEMLIKHILGQYDRGFSKGKKSPTILVVGGWTDRHVYHTCYELRRYFGREARIGTCSALTASAREESHWAALDRMSNVLDVEVCHTVVRTIAWCKDTTISVDTALKICGLSNNGKISGASDHTMALSAPKIQWLTKIPGAFHHEIDTKILCLLFRGATEISVGFIGGGLSSSLVLTARSISSTGQRGAQSVVKIDKSIVIAGEHHAFKRVEDHLGNNAPRITGFVDLGVRAGIRFRYTAMASKGKGSFVCGTLADAVCRMQPGVHEIIDEIYDDIFESWHTAALPRQFQLLRYYCSGFQSSIGRTTSAAHMNASEVRLVTGFLLDSNTRGDEPGLYHRKEPRFYTQASFTGFHVQFHGLPYPVRNLGDLLDESNTRDGIVLVGKLPPQQVLSTYAHGDANMRNFLVDTKSNVWVIDFALSHPDNHVLRDPIRTLTSGLYATIPLETTNDLKQMCRIAEILCDIIDLHDPLPHADLVFDPKNTDTAVMKARYMYVEVVCPIMLHVSRICGETSTNSIQFHIAFFSEALRHLWYVTPTIFCKQFAYVSASLAVAACVRVARRQVSATPTEIELDDEVRNIMAPLSRLGISNFSYHMQTSIGSERKSANVLHHKKSSLSSDSIHDIKLWNSTHLAYFGEYHAELMEQLSKHKLVMLPPCPEFHLSESILQWVVLVIQLLCYKSPASRTPPVSLVICWGAEDYQRRATTALCMLLIALGASQADACLAVKKSSGADSARSIHKKKLERFGAAFKRHMINLVITPAIQKLNDRPVAALNDPEKAGVAQVSSIFAAALNPLMDVTPRRISPEIDQSLLTVSQTPSLPISVPTLPSSKIVMPAHFSLAESTSDHVEAEKGANARTVVKNVEFMQSLALRKLLVTPGDVPLDEFLSGCRSFFSDQNAMLSPLDLSGISNEPELVLRRFVADSLMVAEKCIRFEQILNTEGGAKGNTGDVVRFITDTNPVRPNMLAVVKLFGKMHTFEQELAAFARATNLVNKRREVDFAVELQDISDKDDEDEDDDMQQELQLSRVDYLQLHVPQAIASEFASLPGAGRGGVLIMTPAVGSPLDDLIIRVARSVPGTAYREALMERLVDAVRYGATGLNDFHSRLISSSPASSLFEKQWRICKDIIRKIFVLISDREHNDMISKISENLKDGIWSEIKGLLGGSEKSLLTRAEALMRLARQNPGLGCVSHGDAHSGNLFISTDDTRERFPIVTLIDLESMNRSIGPDGSAIGSAAEDIANFVHKLGQHGRDFGLSEKEILRLEMSALSAYFRPRRMKVGDTVVKLKPDPQALLTNEMFEFLFFRRLIGEVHRRIDKHLNSVRLACKHVQDLFKRLEERAAMSTDSENSGSASQTGEYVNQAEETLTVPHVWFQPSARYADEDSDANSESSEEDLESGKTREDEIAEPGASPRATEANNTIVSPSRRGDENRKKSLHRNRETLEYRSLTRNVFRWKRRMFGPIRHHSDQSDAEHLPSFVPPAPIPDGSTVFVVIGDLGSHGPAVSSNVAAGPLQTFEELASLPSNSSTLSAPMQTLLKRLVGQLSSAMLQARKNQVDSEVHEVGKTPHILFVGGRTHSHHVSVARRMMRWFREFRIPSRLMVEELSMTIVEQVFYARAFLLAHRFRRGRLVILCRHAELSHLAGLFHRAFEGGTQTSSQSIRITYRFVNVIVEGDNQSSGMTDTEAAYARQQCNRFQSLPLSWPYKSANLGILAARSGALLLVKRFAISAIKSGESVDTQRDRGGRTALHIACALGHYDCVYLLLKLGANVNLRVATEEGNSQGGATALHFAVAGQRLEIVELLMEHGASVSTCMRARVDNVRSDPDGMDLSHPSFASISISAFGLWNGCLLPYEILRLELDRQDRNSQSIQPKCTAIMFLTQPVSLESLVHHAVPTRCAPFHKKLIFVRHGESLYNAHGSKRMTGLQDAHLTIRGYRQCQYLANILRRTLWLESLNVSLVCVSPLARALQTYAETFKWFVDEMNEKHGHHQSNSNPKIRVRIDPRLAERLSHSSSKGSPKSVLEKMFPGIGDFSHIAEKWWYQSSVVSGSPVESDKHLRMRAQKFLRWVTKQPEECVLIVGHGACMRMMLQTSMSSNGFMPSRPEVKTGSGLSERGKSDSDSGKQQADQKFRLDVLGYSTLFGHGIPSNQETSSKFPPIAKSFRCNLDMATCLLQY